MSADTKPEQPKRKLKTFKKSKVEKKLEAALFGSDNNASYLDPLVNTGDTPAWARALGGSTDDGKSRKRKLEDDESSVLSTLNTQVKSVLDENAGEERRPAWQDDDEEEQEFNIATTNRLRKLRQSADEVIVSAGEYENRLRDYFSKSTTDASWAELPSENTDETSSLISNMLSSSSKLTYEGRGKRHGAASDLAALPSGKIEVTRMPDANIAARNMSVTSSARFHPNGELFMTAGLDKTLRLFHLDCENNPKVQSVVIPDLPILCARFNHDGTEVIASGRRKFFYSYDLVKGVITKTAGLIGREEKSLEMLEVSPDGSVIAIVGTDGCILLLSGRSKQLIGTLHASASVEKIAFSGDSTYIYATTRDGMINTFDVRSRSIVDKFLDEGCIRGTTIAASWDGRYICTGSNSGVANLYSSELTSNAVNTADSYDSYYGGYDQTASIASKKPLKALMNLTTSINHVSFARSGEMMAFASQSKQDQLRLVHLPSMTVFSNWPTDRTPLGYVQDLDFSPSSGLFSIANDKGKVLLYRVNHYMSS